MKQLTIEALPRVVKLEEFARVKSSLEANNQIADQLLSNLRELLNTKPSNKILLDTKIGHTVNKLRKHEDASVRKLASKVLREWKTFYRDLKNRTSIEVRCDGRTELLRMKARSLLEKAIKLETPSDLPESIERTVFQQCSRRVDVWYKRKVRSLCFMLRKRDDIRLRLHEGNLSADELCAMS